MTVSYPGTTLSLCHNVEMTITREKNASVEVLQGIFKVGTSIVLNLKSSGIIGK